MQQIARLPARTPQNVRFAGLRYRAGNLSAAPSRSALRVASAASAEAVLRSVFAVWPCVSTHDPSSPIEAVECLRQRVIKVIRHNKVALRKPTGAGRQRQIITFIGLDGVNLGDRAACLGNKQRLACLYAGEIARQIILYFVNANCCHFVNTFQAPSAGCSALLDYMRFCFGQPSCSCQ